MALYWPEAALAVACAGPGAMEAEQDWPSNVLVISMRAGQADDSDFVETVRELVVNRIFEHRWLLMGDLLAAGGAVPEPRGGTHDGDDATEAERAEARLRRSLTEDGRGWPGGGDGPDGRGGTEGASYWEDPYGNGWLGRRPGGEWLDRGLGYGPEPDCYRDLGYVPDVPVPPWAQLVVSHCDQLVVHE